VQAEVSRPVGSPITSDFFSVPNFEVTNVQSTVEMENGQTLVIGGLLQNEVSGTTRKVPVLGDLPFIGSAFRLVSYDEEETELVILVTPKLVEAMDSSQRPCRLPGHETRRPTDFELFLEGILEAPRGPRDPFPNRRYVPAHKLAEPFSTGVGEGCDQGACNPCGPTSGVLHKAKASSCGTCSTPMTTGTPVVVQPVPQPQPVMAQPQPMTAAPVAVQPAPAAPVVRTSAATMPAPVVAPAAPAPTPSVAPATAPVMPKSSRALIVPSTPTPKEVEPTVPPLPPGSEAPKSDIPELPKSEQP
jgi:pilus assembly protein CpaC